MVSQLPSIKLEHLSVWLCIIRMYFISTSVYICSLYACTCDSLRLISSDVCLVLSGDDNCSQACVGWLVGGCFRALFSAAAAAAVAATSPSAGTCLGARASTAINTASVSQRRIGAASTGVVLVRYLRSTLQRPQ